MNKLPAPKTLALTLMVTLVVMLNSTGCDPGEIGGVLQEDVVPSETGDPEPADGERTTFASQTFPTGSAVSVCRVYVGLNCRTGPSTRYLIVRVLGSGVRGKVLARSGSWHKLAVDGSVCWSYGYYLCAASGSSSPPPPPSPSSSSSSGGGAGGGGWSLPAQYNLTRDGILRTARAFVGFSYWWGGAALPEPHRTSGKDRGRCNSSTYSGHRGPYGADCSGFVSDVWQLPEARSFPSGAHPFSTYHFYNHKTHWSHISRSSARTGDAMVYRGSSGGHMFVLERMDGWGSAWSVEARGCKYGVVRNLRSVGSAYRARRRNGV